MNSSPFKLNFLISIILLLGYTSLLAQSEGTYYIQSVKSGKHLNIEGANTANGTKAIIWPDAGGKANEKFTLENAGNGYFHLKSGLGKYLHIQNGSNKPRALVQLWEGKNFPQAKWKFINAGNGSYYIQSKLGTYMDVQGGKNANGTPVWMWTKNGTDAQKWKLKSAGSSGNLAGTPANGKMQHQENGVNYSVDEKANNASTEKVGTEKIVEEPSYYCIEQKINMYNADDDELGTFITSGNDGVLYPGVILKANALIEGTEESPKFERLPFNINVVGLASANSGAQQMMVNKSGRITIGDISESINDLLRENRSTEIRAQKALRLKQISSKEELQLYGRGYFKGYGAMAEVKVSTRSQKITNTFIGKYWENHFTMKLDFNPDLIAPGERKPAADDVYISEVSYGRIGYVKIESSLSEDSLGVIVNAAYEGYEMRAEAEARINQLKSKGEWSFTAVILGGSTSSNIGSLKEFKEWINNSKYNAAVAYKPIAYKMKFLNSHTIAHVNSNTTFTKRECYSYSKTKITFLGMSATLHNVGDCSRIGLDMDCKIKYTMADRYMNESQIKDKERTAKLVQWNKKDRDGNPVTKKPQILNLIGNSPKKDVCDNQPAHSCEQLEKLFTGSNNSVNFKIDQQLLEAKKVDLEIHMNFRAGHKGGDFASDYNAKVRLDKNTFIYNLKSEILSNVKRGTKASYFAINVNADQGHRYRFYFKVQNL